MDDIHRVEQRRFHWSLSFADVCLFAAVHLDFAGVVAQINRAIQQRDFGVAVVIRAQLKFRAANRTDGGGRAELHVRRFFAAEKIKRAGFQIEDRLAVGIVRRQQREGGLLIDAEHAVVGEANGGAAVFVRGEPVLQVENLQRLGCDAFGGIRGREPHAVFHGENLALVRAVRRRRHTKKNPGKEEDAGQR